MERPLAKTQRVLPAGDAPARENLYLVVHKGLRLCMSDTLSAVGRIDPRDEDDALGTIARARSLGSACYYDHELHAIHGAIVASIAPADMLSYVRWMVPAASPTERAALLSGMRRGAPREAFAAVIGVVKPTLTGREWAKLEHALGPAPVRG